MSNEVILRRKGELGAGAMSPHLVVTGCRERAAEIRSGVYSRTLIESDTATGSQWRRYSGGKPGKIQGGR